MKTTMSIAAILLVACGGKGGSSCPVGAEGCECTPGGGCDPGLECVGSVCVNTTADTGTDPDMPVDTQEDTVGDVDASDTPGDENEASDGSDASDGADLADAEEECTDSDDDGVCDPEDECPGHDDAQDADSDGVADGCDACPGFDDALDADGDAVPDGCDACPGHDDALDLDGDTVPNGCDICPGGDDLLDGDGNGIPDSCPLRVLIVEGFGSVDLEAFLVGWGFTVTRIPGASLTSSFDYGPYDVVAMMFDSTLADAAHLASASAAGNVGLVMHRSDSLVDDFDMCLSAFYQSGEFSIADASHFITGGYAVGILPLDYTYKSFCNPPTANVRVLGTATGPSLVVHDTYRRVVTPYYGHWDGMPWNDDAAVITWRSYMWASGVGAQ